MSTRASDEQLMQRAIELAATARTRTSPNPWVGCVDPEPGRRALRGRHRAPGRAPRRGRRAAVPPARLPAARRLPRPSSRARTTAAPRPAPTRSSPRASARVVVGIEDPDPQVAGEGIARLRAAGDRGRRRACADEVRGTAGALPQAPAHRPAVGGAEAGGAPSTAAPPRPTARASGSPAPRPGPTPTACGPRATPSSSAPAPCAPTTRRSPSRHVRRSATRCGSCSGTRPTGPRCSPCVELQGELDDVLDELGGEACSR